MVIQFFPLKSDQNFLTLKSDSEMVIKNFEFFYEVVDLKKYFKSFF